MDPTSRITVFEAIRKWRKNQTTIVITHDLSQIQPQDFIYVMKDGQVVEQGYRADLIGIDNGEFGRMTSMQAIAPLPEDDKKRWHPADDIEEMLDEDEADPDASAPTFLKPRPNSRNSLRPPSMGFLAYLDVLSEYASRESFIVPPGSSSNRLTVSGSDFRASSQLVSGRPLSHITVGNAWPRPTSRLDAQLPRPVSRLSAGWTHPRNAIMQQRLSYLTALPAADDVDDMHVNKGRSRQYVQGGEVESGLSTSSAGAESKSVAVEATSETPDRSVVQPPSAFALIRQLYPTLPKKWMLFLGVICSVGHGVLTPLWAKYIAELMAEVSSGGTNGSALARTAWIVLAISAADAAAVLGQYYFLDCLATLWATSMRKKAFDLVLRQPQEWFDQRDNSASRLVQILVKDADDMRPLMSMIIGRIATVVVMLSLGLTWAMVIGWRITLVGLALAPIFGLVFAVGSHFINLLERRNKSAREALSRLFYEVNQD